MKTKTLACSLASTVALGALALGACKKENKADAPAKAPTTEGGTAATDPAKDPTPTPAPADPAPAPAPADPAPAPADPAPGATAAGGAGALELLSAGSAPQHLLTYRVPAGTKQKMEMSIDMAMEVPMMGNMTMPTMIMYADVQVTDVKDGVMTSQMTFTGADVRDTKDSMPGLADMIKGELGKVKGMKTTMTIDPSGKVLDMKVDGAAGDPMLEQTMNQAKQSLDQMVAQLPTEPVGKGAKWRVKQTVDSGGMKIDQVTSYELVAVTDKTATVKAVSTMSAPPQDIDQGGMTVKLEKLDGTASHEMKIDFTKVVPGVKGQMSMKMSMNAMGQQADMTMSTKMDIKAK